MSCIPAREKSSTGFEIYTSLVKHYFLNSYIRFRLSCFFNSNKKVMIATIDRLGISKEGRLDNESCKLNTIIQTSSTEYQVMI